LKPSTIKYRLSKLSDVAHISRLHSSHYNFTASKEQISVAVSERLVFVAECRSEVLAYIILKQYSPDIAEITDLFVSKPYRFRGIGSSLVDEAEKLIKSNYSSVIVHTSNLYHSVSKSSSEGFYEEIGYKIIHDTGDTKILIKNIGNPENG